MGEEASNSLMDDLAAAWDSAETEEVETDGIDSEQQELSEESAPDEPPRSEGESEPAAELELVQDDTLDTPSEQDESDKPPVGLSPAAREAWKDTPESVRSEIAKREKDYENGIMKYAENAKRAEGMDRVLQPFNQLFAMNGGPAQTLPGLLQTASILQMGAPQQKAKMVADLIKQFGVDIGTLDSMLVGEAPQQNPEDQVSKIVDQRMQQFIQQQQEAQNRQQMGVVNSEIEQFSTDPKNEFYRDVRGDMADLLDLAAKRGQSMSLSDAYQKACAMNPQISQILASRTSSQSAAQKRSAASSISGSPGGPGGSPEAQDIRSALELAWDTAGRT